MSDFPDYAQFPNAAYIEELHAKYRVDPLSVEASWRHFFEGMQFSGELSFTKSDTSPSLFRIQKLIGAYRRFGHLLVHLNPIGSAPTVVPELSLARLGFTEAELSQLFPTAGFCSTEEAPLSEIIAALQKVYSSRIGFEYMDLGDVAVEAWLQEKIEPNFKSEFPLADKRYILELLGKAELFETFIHTKFIGQKRFSLEGGETLIPLLAELIDHGASLGLNDVVIGMAHRGRLNVLANILNKPYSFIFQEFEDSILPLLFEGNGDVKYHKGFSATILNRANVAVRLHLAANSSCLEAVDPVVLGQTRARRDLQQACGAILIHGDASFTGQGVIYESLQLMSLPGYQTAGTIHVIVNNQIGFTTLPEEGRSTRYCTDIAKAFGCPVFHVNAEDPESCLLAAKLSAEFRVKFKKDVFIDLNCYRKYGHNEGDEPAFTQPLQYQMIRAKKTIRQLYVEQLKREGAIEEQLAEELAEQFRTTLNVALERGKKEEPHLPEERYGEKIEPLKSALLFDRFETGVEEQKLRLIADTITAVPADFSPHPKLQKLLQERIAMLAGNVDWAMAEALSFGSLLQEQVPIRMTGQDCRRGTFSHRHAVWVDAKNSSLYFPLASLGTFDIYNSPLSEFACLGFEYGYTWSNRKALVIWEAQFGDFSIGAQTVIDHYIASAEQKWARYSNLVLLLPHGYEGQGPEHSSGRIERFLQLAGVHNMQIVNATTPAQYFHLLRRQALRDIKKPLIVFTPKSLLRLPACSSPLGQFTSGQFEEVLDDPKRSGQAAAAAHEAVQGAVTRVLLCSGKVYYDLLAERERRKREDVAILRIEQLYPIHEAKLKQLFARYQTCSDIRWVQEEPQNMGAWEFIQPFLPSGTRYVGRPRSAVTATGSFKQHKQELDHFMNEAFA